MEESLDALNIINKSLINEKDELRKKLFEKIINCKCNEKLQGFHSYEVTLFEIASNLFNDEEYKKLRKEYLDLSYLTRSIDYFKKE